MSFHEKSALACFISICLVYVPYFMLVFRFPMAALGLFWVSAVGLVALLTGFHIVNALATRSIRTSGGVPPVDELDQRIELKAAKWAGFILAFAVTTWILVAMYALPVLSNGVSPSSYAIPMVTAMTAVHWLFAGFVLANIVYYGGIVFGYRRIASA
ncbi:MAG: hypothetical protein AB4911_15515 [Oscillochloridaceae bacterium umkhey_bin13]